MRRKGFLAAMLASVCMVAFLFSCGRNIRNKEADVSAGQEESKGEETVHLELYTVTFSEGSNEKALERVNQAVNDYVEPLIHAEVRLNMIPYRTYQERVKLIMYGDSQADLLNSVGSLTDTLVAQGAVLGIEEYLETCGKGIQKVIREEHLEANKYGGEIYAVPTNWDRARGGCYFYREDMNQKLELGLEKAETLEDLEACFAVLKQKAPDCYAVGKTGSASLFYEWDWDPLKDGLGVLLNQGAELKVENLFETQDYMELVRRMHGWYEKGYVYPDLPFITVPAADLFAGGNILGYFISGNSSLDSLETRKQGIRMRRVELVEPFVTTSSLQSSSWLIPQNAKYPEKAMELLNLMYTDPVLVNLLCYGIEGEDYAVIDAKQGIIGLPEDADEIYDSSQLWMWGNAMLAYTWESDEEDRHRKDRGLHQAAVHSKALGFTFDSSDVQNEITACSNVAAKYREGLEYGLLDPDEALPKLQSELKAAGIDTVIMEKQKQLDEWADKEL